jgi:hypothetical protein
MKENKDRIIMLRVSESMYNDIQDRCGKTGMGMSQYLRFLVSLDEGEVYIKEALAKRAIDERSTKLIEKTAKVGNEKDKKESTQNLFWKTSLLE